MGRFPELMGSHAYAITGYDPATDKFTAYNPWGVAHPSPLTWAQLQSSCIQFVVADPTGSAFIQGARVNSAADLGLWLAGNDWASSTFDDSSFTLVNDGPKSVDEKDDESMSVEFEAIAALKQTSVAMLSSDWDSTPSASDEYADTIQLIDEVMAELGSMIEMV